MHSKPIYQNYYIILPIAVWNFDTGSKSSKGDPYIWSHLWALDPEMYPLFQRRVGTGW